MKPLLVFKIASFPEKSETFVLTSAVGAIKAGYDVRILVDKKNTLADSSQPELVEAFDLFEKTKVLSQPKSKQLRYWELLKMCFQPRQLKYFFKLAKLKGKRSLDYVFILKFYKNIRTMKVAHVHFAPAVSPILELKKIGYLNVNILVTFHGYDAHFLPQERALRTMIQDYSSWVNHSTVNSSFLKEKLISKGFAPENISVVPIGVDLNFFDGTTQRKKIQPLRLISIGRLIPLKGHRFGIEVVKELKATGMELSYTIIGDGPEKEHLQDLVSQWSLEDCVHFIGGQTQAEIKEALVVHDVFMMTSTYDADQRREAFGLVSIEAQAMGLPVVGFDSGGFPETIVANQTGILVDDRDVFAFVKAIQSLENDRKLLNEMSEHAMKHAENFSLASMLKNYMELYKDD